MKYEPEKRIYWIILIALALSFLGFRYLRYSAYVLPLIAIFWAILSGAFRFNLNRHNLPFLFLLIVSLPTAFVYDINAAKKLIFIAVYSSVFLFIDFSRVRLNLHLFSGILVFLLFYQILVFGSKYGSGLSLEYSFIESRSSYESTLAFPLAVIGIYYFLTQKWALAFFHFIIVVLALKRIAIIAFILIVFIWIIPKSIRRVFLNPYVVTVSVGLLTWFSIAFAYGQFDRLIINLFDKSANELSQGRQELWYQLLQGVHFSFQDFILYGEGIGQSITALQLKWGLKSVLTHNDILSIFVELGLLAMMVFVFLINNQRSLEERGVALFITILFLTDNVLIYQHVMLAYLLVQSQLANMNKKSEVIKIE